MAISITKKKRIWDASDHRCSYCHQPLTFENMTMDHIVSQSAVKSPKKANADSNLCVACKTCNSAKAAMSIKEFRTFVNRRNNELLKLEADRRAAIARVSELDKEIESRKFAFIHYLRNQAIKNI